MTDELISSPAGLAQIGETSIRSDEDRAFVS